MPTPKRAVFTPMDSWRGEHLSYKQSIEGQYSFQVFEPPSNARVEAYNLTNTPHFNNPNGSVASSNFLSITSTSGNALSRQIRLGARISF